MSEKTPAQDAEKQGDPSFSVKTGSAEEPKENSGLISGAPKKLVSLDGSPPNPTKKSSQAAPVEHVSLVWNMQMMRDGLVACVVLACLIIMLLFGTTHTGLKVGTTLGACLADNGALPSFPSAFQMSLQFRTQKNSGDADRIHHNLEEVYCGDRITTSVFTHSASAKILPPVVVYPAYGTAMPGGTGPYFSLIMVDPDYPKPAALNFGVQSQEAEYLHWMVVNITGSDVSTGSTVMPYKPPPHSPDESDGVHRYTVLLFAHRNPLNGSSGYPWPTARTNFNTSLFWDAHGLPPPVAGTVFRSGKGGAR
jgi:phosphatidylethanolamine-binding protein (PEBP) family uncharacterized protein